MSRTIIASGTLMLACLSTLVQGQQPIQSIVHPTASQPIYPSAAVNNASGHHIVNAGHACGGIQSGCHGCGCVNASELWAEFSSQTNCRGCVKRNRLIPRLPGLGGHPAGGGCDLPCGGCSSGFAVPGVSVHWPVPVFNGDACGCQPRIKDLFTPLGRGWQRPRCDIPNDCFGRLGESRVCDAMGSGADTEKHQIVPPAPVPMAPAVEPASTSNRNDSVHSASLIIQHHSSRRIVN